jgi:hypothetical protein
MRLTILIPALGSIKKLEDTLVSVLTHRPAKSQIVVVLGVPYDDQYGLRGEVCFVETVHGAGMAECLNAGLAVSRGPIVHVLGCGVEVSPEWFKPVFPHFHEAQVAAVAPVIFDRFRPQRIISAGVGYRSSGAAWRLSYHRRSGATPCEQAEWFGPDLLAAFYRKSALESIGGFNPAYGDDLAAVDCALALRRAGYRTVSESASVTWASRKEVRRGLRLGHGRENERLFWHWASQLGRSGTYWDHAGLWAGEFFEGVLQPAAWVRLGGRFWEILKIPFGDRTGVSPNRLASPGGKEVAHSPLTLRKAS